MPLCCWQAPNGLNLLQPAQTAKLQMGSYTPQKAASCDYVGSRVRSQLRISFLQDLNLFYFKLTSSTNFESTIGELVISWSPTAFSLLFVSFCFLVIESIEIFSPTFFDLEPTNSSRHPFLLSFEVTSPMSCVYCQDNFYQKPPKACV